MADSMTFSARTVQGVPAGPRHAGPLPNPHVRRRYWLILGGLTTLALLCGFGLLAWGNPMPPGSRGFWIIAKARANNLTVMLVVAVCQALATVAFQTVTNNRIITPSIMGFESLYMAVQTSAVYFMGATGLLALQGVPQFIVQVLLMVGFSLALYGWLLSGKYANLHVMLLIGIVLGGGLRAVSTFMQRLLTPSEFDILATRLFGNVSNADPGYLPVAIPMVVVAGGLVFVFARRLNVVALGRETSINLGFNHRTELIRTLLLVSVLMGVSTALVGPMTFFGFLVAILAYQFADTYDHRFIFPMAVLIGFVVLSGAYLLMHNVFYAQGVVSIIIELIGGSVFLFVILRKGRL